MDRNGACQYMSAQVKHIRSPEFFLAWVTEEQGWGNEITNNNPANLSFSSTSLPTEEEVQKYPWFAHVLEVLPNRVCVYDDLIHGCDATIDLLKADYGKVLTASNDLEAFTFLQPWASNPYYVKELQEIYQQITKTPIITKPSVQYYRVVGGDSLWEIARKFNMSLEELEKLNPQIPNYNLIFVGQEIRVS